MFGGEIGRLPADGDDALLVGRVSTVAGPTPVIVRSGMVHDLSGKAATMADLLERDDIADLDGPVLGRAADLMTGTLPDVAILSPFDLQCIKAAGVTFALSAIERVIEERARGDAAQAALIRASLEEKMGADIRLVEPGSAESRTLKAALIEAGMWSQYLEVAIGPDAEIFTKAPILSTLGTGAEVGVRSDSSWNNPEPEIVLAVTADGRIVGATLGNDVNLRDFEGRSALLLGKAKDNNASCAIGPFIRLFDDRFGMDDVRTAEVSLEIVGEDGYRLTAASRMSEISRDPEALVAQTLSEHQYPDGFALFLGTLFAPVQDRDERGGGFTHKLGDLVTIASPRLGTLVNRVTTSKIAPPWTFGARALMANLSRRDLLTV